mgnify:FL=1
MSRFKVYSDASGTVNSTLISIGDQAVIVVDTQASEEGGRLVLNQVEGQLLFVFNTHEHHDHIGGNPLFDCRIISSTAAQEAMVADNVSAGLPNCHFDEQLHMHTGGEEIRLQHFGGHCPGASVMYLPQRRLLLTGNMIFNGRAPWMGQADFPTWIAALAELSTWDVETVVPGHGPVGGKELLREQQTMLQNFVADVQGWQHAAKTEAEMIALAAERYGVKPNWYDMLRMAFKCVPRP